MGKTIKLSNNTYLANDLYSTNEKIIGMLDDGTLVYKKFIKSTTPSRTYELLVSNVDMLIDSFGSIKYDGINSRPINMIGIVSANSYFRVDLDGSGHKIYSNLTTDLENKEYNLTLIYTKTSS